MGCERVTVFLVPAHEDHTG